MALTLAESAKLTNDALVQGVIAKFIENSPFLAKLPFVEIQGNSLKYNQEGELANVDFRAVNSAYVESASKVNNKSADLVILGGDVDVDRFIQQTRSNINDQRAVQTALKVKALSRFFDSMVINGDSAVQANGFDGLKKLVGGTSQEIVAGANGADLTLAMLDELLDAVGDASALVMSKAMRRKVKALLQASSHYIENGTDDFGRQVMMYNGTPIQILGVDNKGAEILDFNETQGTGTTTGSIYAVRYGEDGFAGVTNGGVMVDDLGEIAEKPVFRTRIEFYSGIAMFGADSVARLKGINA